MVADLETDKSRERELNRLVSDRYKISIAFDRAISTDFGREASWTEISNGEKLSRSESGFWFAL